jgi:hypothetical protein
MKEHEVRERAFAMPLTSPAFPVGPYRLLNFLLSNCTWKDGEVVATFGQPFDLLAETAVVAARAAAGETAKTARTEIWLGN